MSDILSDTAATPVPKVSDQRSDTFVTAILLAAGSSRRFGADNKLLAILDGKPLIRHGAEALCAAGLGEVIVVTGPDADRVGAALAGLAVRLVHNHDHLAGMGGSVAAGIRATSPSARGALVCPSDMPRLNLELIGRLIDAFTAGDCQLIVYPSLPDGSQRNPVLWPARLFGALAELSGEMGAKAVLQAHMAEAVAVPAEPAPFLDIDTAEDLARQVARNSAGTQTG